MPSVPRSLVAIPPASDRGGTQRCGIPPSTWASSSPLVCYRCVGYRYIACHGRSGLTRHSSQVLTLLFMQSASNWRHAWWAQPWSHLSERPIEERQRRPLLTATISTHSAHDSGEESEDIVRYSDLNPHYGTTGEGQRGRIRTGSSRIEPSSLRNVENAENAWRDE